MNDNQETEDEKKTADIYHFRSRRDLWLFCAFIVLVLLAILYMTMHTTVKA